MKARQHGFTIIELMIVLAIIGVLSAIAIPAYQDYTIRAQISEGLTMSEEVKAHFYEHYSNRGSVPADNAAASLATSTLITGNYVASIDAAGGFITIVYGGRANSNIAAATNNKLVLEPFVNAQDQIIWRCGYAPDPTGGTSLVTGTIPTTVIAEKYLPSDCRS